jgi:hypothetical protein
MYDSSGIPISTFAPITITLSIPGFAGENANITHLNDGQTYTAIRIAPGVYQFSVTGNSEYQILDGYVNGVLMSGKLKNAVQTALIEPMRGGTFKRVGPL